MLSKLIRAALISAVATAAAAWLYGREAERSESSGSRRLTGSPEVAADLLMQEERDAMVRELEAQL